MNADSAERDAVLLRLCVRCGEIPGLVNPGDGLGGDPDFAGPGSACWECGEIVPVGDLWIGKETGTALCALCLAIWEKTGRAKIGSSGEF